jgi:hypothetical protein
MKKNKTKINYIVDMIIGIGFLLSAVSGIVLLLAGSGGYQGGRNPRYMSEILFLSRSVWKDIHNWSSIIMAAGVALHFVLHWNWLVCMTRSLFRNVFREKSRCLIEGNRTACETQV